jgi:hypothetical protein
VVVQPVEYFLTDIITRKTTAFASFHPKAFAKDFFETKDIASQHFVANCGQHSPYLHELQPFFADPYGARCRKPRYGRVASYLIDMGFGTLDDLGRRATPIATWTECP